MSERAVLGGANRSGPRLRVAMVARSNTLGGGAVAAVRLAEALEQSGDAAVRIHVAEGEPSNFVSVAPRTRLGRNLSRIGPRIEARALRSVLEPQADFATMGVLQGSAFREATKSRPHILHLHWISGAATIRQIGRYKGPLVWTMHDAWAAQGIFHYPSESSKEGSPTRSTRVDGAMQFMKQRLWRRPIVAICPSAWMRDLITESPVSSAWTVLEIPNTVSTDVFSPGDRAKARSLVGLPSDALVLMFVSGGGISNPRKGWTEFVSIVDAVCRNSPRPTVALVVGARDTSSALLPAPTVPTYWLGELKNDIDLCNAYRAASLVVIPSSRDNLPNVALEAQASGTPVAAFQVGGLASTVRPGVTGLLAPPTSSALADAIVDAVHSGSLERMGKQAREEALAKWSPDTVSRSHLDAYEMALEMVRPGRT